MNPSSSTGARIVARRRLEWADTDAAGHNHFSVAFRWMEEVEGELRRNLGLPVDLTGGMPRVHVEVDYRERIWYADEVVITMWVEKVGSTSCGFAWQVRRDSDAGSLLMEGSHIAVNAPDPKAGAQPWPEDYRRALEEGIAISSAP